VTLSTPGAVLNVGQHGLAANESLVGEVLWAVASKQDSRLSECGGRAVMGCGQAVVGSTPGLV
jgi:hypothetical protein